MFKLLKVCTHTIIGWSQTTNTALSMFKFFFLSLAVVLTTDQDHKNVSLNLSNLKQVENVYTY